MQTRLQSALESATNIAIGYVVALGGQLAIFPMFGMIVPLSDNLLIGAMFTVISLVRSYAVRRMFNRRAQPTSVAWTSVADTKRTNLENKGFRPVGVLMENDSKEMAAIDLWGRVMWEPKL